MTKAITTALGSAALLGASGALANINQNAVALPNEEESVLGGSEYTKSAEVWELSYDAAMAPYVEDYRRCLEHTNLILDGTPNVEKQHRAALPRCADVRAKAIEESNAAIARRGRSGTMPPSAVVEAFKVVGYIHIQRGRNFDDQSKLQRRATDELRRKYQAAVAAREGALVGPDSETKDMPNAEDQ